jgi:hypothetical protein
MVRSLRPELPESTKRNRFLCGHGLGLIDDHAQGPVPGRQSRASFNKEVGASEIARALCRIGQVMARFNP